MKRVVLHHAHHEDEGVYRMMIGVMQTQMVPVEMKNPNHDPEDEGSSPTIVIDEEQDFLIESHDIVWDASDEKWKDKSAEEIAAIQQNEITEHFAAQDEAVKIEEARITNIGTTGYAL